MTKQEILDAIHGKMIVSCQAIPGEPLYMEDDSVMYLMARAAKRGRNTGNSYKQHPGCCGCKKRNRASGYRACKD